jgi:hypothetical protein
MASEFGRRARGLAAQVAAGNMTQEEAEFELGLTSGERLCPNGVISGSAAHPDIPRHGADETDNDYSVPAEPWASMYAVADLMDTAVRKHGS